MSNVVGGLRARTAYARLFRSGRRRASDFRAPPAKRSPPSPPPTPTPTPPLSTYARATAAARATLMNFPYLSPPPFPRRLFFFPVPFEPPYGYPVRLAGKTRPVPLQPTSRYWCSTPAACSDNFPRPPVWSRVKWELNPGRARFEMFRNTRRPRKDGKNI